MTDGVVMWDCDGTLAASPTPWREPDALAAAQLVTAAKTPRALSVIAIPTVMPFFFLA